MSGIGVTNTAPPSKKSRRPVRWLSVLVTLAVILVSGSVLATVVLTYQAASQVGPSVTGPLQFQQGGNYANAHAIGVTTATFPGGSATAGPAVLTTLNGVNQVVVQLFDIVEFSTAVLTTAPSIVNQVQVPAPAPVVLAGLVCAYAFVSTAVPALGAVGVAGQPAGCSATVPALGAVSAGCVGGTAAVVTINLVTGAIVSGSLAGTCTVPTGTAAGTVALYVSYAITTNAAIAGTTALNTFTVPVTVP